jgi:putative ABC transport system permease protein
MNLALRDIRYKLGRFMLTCLGLSLLIAVVVTMAGIYRGLVADALSLTKAIKADLWIVEKGTHGPFAESSRIPGDTREMVARITGVAEAGSITLQNVQLKHGQRNLRLQIVGYEPDRPGGPHHLIAGRPITSGHYELIADRQTGLDLGETLHLGQRGHDYTVVGLTSGVVTLSGDSIVFTSLQDAQKLQFELAPPAERRETARGAQRTPTDLVNAVVVRLRPNFAPSEVANVIRRWKHLSVLTDKDQAQLLTRWVIEMPRRQLGFFMSVLTVVSGVIIALIIYTLTMDKIREIATLKLIGAPDRTIVGLIMQQALLMGVVSFVGGVALVYAFNDRFPRSVIMLPQDIGALFGLVVIICLLASLLGVRVALRVDPSRALTG